MIQAVRVPTVEEFHQRSASHLLQNEAQNSLFLGIASNLLSKVPADRQEHYFWVVEEDGAWKGAAFWTPPYRFTLTEMEAGCLQVLADEIRDTFPGIPGVGGPKESSARFSHFWNLKTRKAPFLEMSMRIYQLEKPAVLSASPGALQTAEEEHTGFLVGWTRELNREAGLNDGVEERKIVEGYIRERRLFLWQDGGYRAMAGYGRETPNSFSVNMVYTPPDFRRKGYATSLVSALSRRLLDSGKKTCCLYADLLNPVSNGIYQKIGYQPVGDWNAYRFKNL